MGDQAVEAAVGGAHHDRDHLPVGGAQALRRVVQLTEVREPGAYSLRPKGVDAKHVGYEPQPLRAPCEQPRRSPGSSSSPGTGNHDPVLVLFVASVMPLGFSLATTLVRLGVPGAPGLYLRPVLSATFASTIPSFSTRPSGCARICRSRIRTLRGSMGAGRWSCRRCVSTASSTSSRSPAATVRRRRSSTLGASCGRRARSARSLCSSIRDTAPRRPGSTRRAAAGTAGRARSSGAPAAALAGCACGRRARASCRCSWPMTGRNPVFSGLTRYAGAMIEAGALPPFRARCCRRRATGTRPTPPPPRTGARSPASGCRRSVSPCTGRPVGLGASLGALAWLHAHWTLPGILRRALPPVRAASSRPATTARVRLPALRALHPLRVARAAAASRDPPNPVTLTCGTGEENLGNNRPSRKRSRARAGRRAGRAPRRRTTGSPGATRSTPTSPSCSAGARMRRGGPDGVAAYGLVGAAAARLPGGAGKPVEWERTGHDRCDRRADRGGQGQALLRRLVGLGTWHDDSLPLEERARRHGAFEDWLLAHVVPWIHADCSGSRRSASPASPLGAFHAANLTLRRADLFPLALCLSGFYDIAASAGASAATPSTSTTRSTTSPISHGEHLDWLCSRAHLLLVVGRGAWEDSTGALDSTHRFASLLAGKGIPHELDVWGEDSPHDWPAWQRQIAHHLPRFVLTHDT